jgi:hypothetical protein
MLNSVSIVFARLIVDPEMLGGVQPLVTPPHA